MLHAERQLKSGNTKSCGCLSVHNQETTKRLEDLGWRVLQEGKTSRVKWGLVCRNGHTGDRIPQNILATNSPSCPECSGRRPPLSEEDIRNDCAELLDKELVGISSLSGSNSTLHLKCHLCSQEYTQLYSNVIYRFAGCPYCAKYGFSPELPAYLYLIKYRSDAEEFLKIGITNNCPTQRLRKQENKSIFIGEVVGAFYYKSGKVAKQLEKSILKEIPFGYIPKHLFTDGYTETTDMTQLPKILKTIKENSHRL